MKFYCAECFEELGNCQPWCSERQRDVRSAANSLGELHATNCVACAAMARQVRTEEKI